MLKLIYLWLITFVSFVFSFRKRRNVIYLMSFADVRLARTIAKYLPSGQKLIILATPEVWRTFGKSSSSKVVGLPFREGLKFALTGIPKVMSGRLIVCDNYYPFLGGLARSPKVVQIWHADGAIKRFGWQDPRTPQRGFLARRRFQAVYDHFNEYVVASKAMGRVFARSYHVPESRMKLLGDPHSDRYLDSAWLKLTRQRIYRKFPELKRYRVILYAPTYRPGVTFRVPSGLGSALTADPHAIVILKFHPALAKQWPRLIRHFKSYRRVQFCPGFSTDELLTVTETLVTDYSSVAFDYSLLPNAHTLLFYMFDASKFKKVPGIQSHSVLALPGQPLFTSRQLAMAIRADSRTPLAKFNCRWNGGNDGRATARFVKRYIET